MLWSSYCRHCIVLYHTMCPLHRFVPHTLSLQRQSSAFLSDLFPVLFVCLFHSIGYISHSSTFISVERSRETRHDAQGHHRKMKHDTAKLQPRNPSAPPQRHNIAMPPRLIRVKREVNVDLLDRSFALCGDRLGWVLTRRLWLRLGMW